MTDTHLHLTDLEAFPSPDEVVLAAQEAGVGALITIGTEKDSSKHGLAYAEKFESVYAAVGIHPNYSNTYNESEITLFEEMAKHPKCVAIGEIGLDYHWDFATPEHQQKVFEKFLVLAQETDKPVVLHARKANQAVLDTLKKYPRPNRYLFHCFSGNQEELEQALALEAYFGVDGPLTYKKSHELRELVKLMPRDRVLLETDSPYLSPEPFRGKRNTPANIPYICKALADCWGVSVEEASAITDANAQRFFALDPA